MKPDSIRINVKGAGSFVSCCEISNILYSTERTHVRVDLDINAIGGIIDSLIYLKESYYNNDSDFIKGQIMEESK